MICHPPHLHIHDGVVCYIDRIRNVPQPFAEGRAPGVRSHGAGSRQHDEREYQQDADGLIDAVGNAGGAAYAGYREDDDEQQGAPPEAASKMDGRAAGIGLGAVSGQDAGNQQTAEEGVQQTRESDINLLSRQAPAADDRVLRTVREETEHVPAQRQVQREERAGEAQDRQRDLGQMAQHEGVKDIADILEGQRPVGTVERVHFLPAADVKPGTARNHQQTHDKAKCELPPRNLKSLREIASGKEEQGRAHQRTGDHHRMQTRETALEESPCGHPVPAVVIGVADDEAAQHKEEIHRQIAVVHYLRPEIGYIGLETVEDNHHQRGHSAQPVEYLVTGFRCQINVLFCHSIA